MKTKLRFIAIILVISMIFPILSGVIQPVFAADFQLENMRVTYNESTATATITWNAVEYVASGTLEYNVPNGVSYNTVSVPLDPTKNSISVERIKKDIIYDFKISLLDESNQSYEGTRYFLAGITVTAENVKQQSENMDGGGMDTGIYPAIKLSWKMPKVYNSNQIYYANEIPYIFDAVNINFKFKIELDTMLKDVVVKRNAGNPNDDFSYTAVISEGTAEQRNCNVNWDMAAGKFSFYLLGRKDANTVMPSSGLPDTLPEGISMPDQQYVLPYPDLLPSTIYKISMITTFDGGSGSYAVDGILQSPIDSDYICSPIRFQLTKDTSNYLYVRVFRVNQKGVQLQSLIYDIQKSYGPPSWIGAGTQSGGIDDSELTDPSPIIDIIRGEENTVYYRIVVTEGKIESPVMEYRMQDDLAKPPVPRSIQTSVELQYPPSGSTISETSSRVTITWDYPGDTLWNQIKGENYYYHFSLSLAENPIDTPQRLIVDGREMFFDVKYRDVKSVNANVIEVDRSGATPRLKYVMDGYELFKGTDGYGDPFDLPNEEEYPNYLLPNKTYYLQMYTSVEDAKDKPYNIETMSEKSLKTSFTTLSPSSRDVPVPKYLEKLSVNVGPSGTAVPKEATIKIRFDHVNIDNWENYTPEPNANDRVYYDLFMSTSPDISTFIEIGSTENVDTGTPQDVIFSEQYMDINNDRIVWQDATINKFTLLDNIAKFGNSLTPNATYYFMVKVRLVMVYDDMTKQSVPSYILPVTVPRGEPTDPDEDDQKPRAPEDFAIAVDENGDLMVKGQSVTFEWTIRETQASYNLIATTNKVAPDATLETGSSILTDPTYMSFINAFGNKDNNLDGDSSKLTLNPNVSQLPPNFVTFPGSEPGTIKCRYTIDTWLYPNKVYYFSLRSEIKGEDNEIKSSVWISIPVTTTLIESPTMLQVVNDCSLAFYWYGSLPTENYQIRLKPVGEVDYILLTKAQYTIVKDSRDYNYARTTREIKLKPDTQYNIQVISKVGGVENIIDIGNSSANDYYTTRDDYHEIDIRWQGVAIDPLTEFEVAIKTEDDADYTVLNNSMDLEQYVDISTHSYPYYIEKTLNNLNTGYYTYNARIKSVEITLPDGTKEHRPLKANTKYYIKVRAKKTDSSNTEVVARSKYVGPVDTRTEFSQDDYDDDDQNTDVSAKFLDMLDKLEEDVFWEVNKGTGILNKVYIRDERIVNMLESEGQFALKIDISQSANSVNGDEIYMAKSILNAMKNTNRSVIIKSKEIEYTIRPDTFDVENMEEFKNAVKLTGSKDVFIQLNNFQSADVQPNTPENITAASRMNVLSVQTVASTLTSGSIKDMIKDKLYNDKTGIIQKKLEVLKNPNNTNTKGDEQAVNKYLLQLLEDIKSELSYYIEDKLNGAGYSSGVFIQKYTISKFSSPVAVKMPYKGSTLANPYVLYDGNGNWQKLSQNIKRENGFLNYFVTATGRYVILSAKDITSSIADDNGAKPYIAKLAENYDLASVFSGAETSFNPNLNVTVKEVILLYELISEAKVDGQKSLKDKAKDYGIDKLINTVNINRNISRQEAAAVVIKLYCQRTGADYTLLRTSYNKMIKDDKSIADKYAIPVYICLQMNLMSLDANSQFNPSGTINRGGIATVFEKMLEA